MWTVKKITQIVQAQNVRKWTVPSFKNERSKVFERMVDFEFKVKGQIARKNDRLISVESRCPVHYRFRYSRPF